jgi:tetratricopeptide (TPR) repeat protein
MTRTQAVGLALTLFRAAVVVAQEAEAIGPTLAAARALIDEGKPAVAIQKLQSLDPTNPRVAHALGVAYYHADDHGRAIELLAPVVSKLPEGSLERREAVQVLGLSLYLAAHLAESVPYLEQTREWAPENIDLAYVLGNAYIQTRQPDKARESFARLFGVAPDSAAAHLLTAQMMVRLEFEELAAAELRKAIAKDPRIPKAHFLLGQAAIFRARFDEAGALLERELEVNPGNAMALYRLGDLYARQSKWDEAIAALRKSLWINPAFSGPYILLGKAYLRKGQSATAEGMLQRAIEYDPNNKSAHYLLAQLFQQAGRAEEAKREFEIAERLPDASGR